MTPPDTANKCACPVPGDNLPANACAEYKMQRPFSWCSDCGHDSACHPIQAPATGEANE